MGRNLYPTRIGEVLTGLVQEKNASDLEERSARAIDKIPEWSYVFRISISPLTGSLTEYPQVGLAGSYEIDFLCIRGIEMLPIMIDGEVSHFLMSWQKIKDEEKDIAINKALKKYNARPVIRIPYWKLAFQPLADQTFQDILL